MIELREYQEECVKRVLHAYHQDPHGTELLVLPTGGGKTVIFSAVIDQLYKEHGLAAMVVAHRDELLDQAADKYRMVKPDAIIGKVGGGIHQYGGELTVASIATISRPEHIKRLRALYGTGKGLFLTIDEAHHSAADGYQAVLEALPDAFVLMVTATPDRLDNKPILPGKSPIYEASIIDMIQQGYLCDIKAIAVKTNVDLNELHTRMGDFQQEELASAVDTPARNKLIVSKYQEHTPGKRAVAFCVTVKHAENLAAAFNEAGIAAGVIEGETPLDERKRIYKAFRAGEILVMCNVMVLSEGWDEPLCSVGIGARPTQSRALFVQQLGRILRLAPGKQFATWMDITDNVFTHRLEPQSLGKVLGKRLKNDETLLEAEEREKRESAEREVQVRKLNAGRDKDLHVDLLEKLLWQERTDGMYVLTVGREQHRIALVPSQEIDGYYSVWAKLFPGYESQQWLTDQPLDWAQQHAEKKARMLLADPKSIGLLDINATWRSQPATEKQISYLKWKKIPFDLETITKGEAQTLRENYETQQEQQKTARERATAQKKIAFSRG